MNEQQQAKYQEQPLEVTMPSAIHIVSEPGDCTRYDYTLVHDDNVGSRRVHIVPTNNMRMPKVYYEDMTLENFIESNNHCNECTVTEIYYKIQMFLEGDI